MNTKKVLSKLETLSNVISYAGESVGKEGSTTTRIDSRIVEVRANKPFIASELSILAHEFEKVGWLVDFDFHPDKLLVTIRKFNNDYVLKA